MLRSEIMKKLDRGLNVIAHTRAVLLHCTEYASREAQGLLRYNYQTAARSYIATRKHTRFVR